MTRSACVALALLAACAPDDMARSSCRSGDLLATGDPWTCTISGPRVARDSWLEFDTESRNHVATVKFAMAVLKGTLRVRYHDLEGGKTLTVTPGAPASVEMRTRLNRDRRSFTLIVEPLGGAVEGLTGTVDYHTR